MRAKAVVAYKLLLFPIYFGRKYFRSFGYANILYLINEKNILISLYDTMMNNWYYSILNDSAGFVLAAFQA